MLNSIKRILVLLAIVIAGSAIFVVLVEGELQGYYPEGSIKFILGVSVFLGIFYYLYRYVRKKQGNSFEIKSAAKFILILVAGVYLSIMLFAGIAFLLGIATTDYGPKIMAIIWFFTCGIPLWNYACKAVKIEPSDDVEEKK